MKFIFLLMLFFMTTFFTASSVDKSVFMDEIFLSQFEYGEDLRLLNEEKFPPDYKITLDDLKADSEVMVYGYKLYTSIFPYKIYSIALIAYEDGKLFYWGNVDSFLRSEDAFIRETGEKAIEIIKEQLVEEENKRREKLNKIGTNEGFIK